MDGYQRLNRADVSITVSGLSPGVIMKSWEETIQEVATQVGKKCLDYPYYAQGSEHSQIDIDVFLDEKIKKILQANQLSGPSLRKSYEVTLEKCQHLRRFIGESPYLFVFPDELCTDGLTPTPKACHTITYDAANAQLEVMKANKLAVVRAQAQQGQVVFTVIAQTAKSALDSVVTNFSLITHEREGKRTKRNCKICAICTTVVCCTWGAVMIGLVASKSF